MMRRHDSRGFMLLEVMLAVVLVAIGLYVLLSGLGRCLAAARAVHTYSLVQNLLSNKSYEFRVERPSDYLDQEGNFEDYPGYTWSRTLTPTDTEALWEQTITVYWWERSKLNSDSVVEYRYWPQKQQ